MVNTHKARWAERKADEIAAKRAERAYVPASDWRRVRRAIQGDDALWAEEMRYRKLARFYRGEEAA